MKIYIICNLKRVTDLNYFFRHGTSKKFNLIKNYCKVEIGSLFTTYLVLLYIKSD